MQPSSAKSFAFWRTRLNALRGFRRAGFISMFYTYVLFCNDFERDRSEFYIGTTEDLRKRIVAHKTKSVKTTKSFDKVVLVYYECCLNKKDSMKRECQLKTGFGRGYIKRRIEDYLENARD